jgi:hypothetical protein
MHEKNALNQQKKFQKAFKLNVGKKRILKNSGKQKKRRFEKNCKKAKKNCGKSVLKKMREKKSI